MEYIASLLRRTVEHNGPVLRYEIDAWLRRDAVEELKGCLYGGHKTVIDQAAGPVKSFWDATIGGLLGSGVTTAVLGTLFLKKNSTIQSEVKAGFDEAFKIFESTRVWKQQALAELFGPLQMQFERTSRAFRRWDKRNFYLEAKIVREANQAMQDILLAKGYLIPPNLMKDASDLLEHFDAWLEEFDRIRAEADNGEEPDFVFVGPSGYPFPKEAERHFKAEFAKLQGELYSG